MYARNVFAQWTDEDGFWTTAYAPPKTIGTSTRYEVLYIAAQQKFQFLANGVSITSPKTAEFIPTRATIAGEITNLASQMPGGYNLGSREWLYTSYYRDNYFTWRAFDNGDLAVLYWQGSNASSYFGMYQWGWWDLDIWDKACAN